MKDGCIITVIGFDSLENREPEYVQTTYSFVSDEVDNWAMKVKKFFNELPPTKLYVGYNREVYPKFKITETKIH